MYGYYHSAKYNDTVLNICMFHLENSSNGDVNLQQVDRNMLQAL